MHRSGRASIRLCHGAALLVLAFLLGALMMARANWKELRADLRSSIRVYALLRPEVPLYEGVLEGIRSLAGVASVRVVPPEGEAKAAILEIEPASVFTQPDALEHLQANLRATGMIEDTTAPIESQQRLAAIVGVTDDAFLAAVIAFVTILFLACAPLEYLRFRADERSYPLSWLADRFFLAFFACLLGTLAAAVAGTWVAALTNSPIAYYDHGDLLLLIVVCLVSPLAWAFIIHAGSHAIRPMGPSMASLVEANTAPPETDELS